MIRFRRGVVTVRYGVRYNNAWRETEQRAESAWIAGELAIVTDPNSPSAVARYRRYSLTHVPSGLAVGYAPTLKIARDAIQAITPLADWKSIHTLPKLRRARDFKEPVAAALIRVGARPAGVPVVETEVIDI